MNTRLVATLVSLFLLFSFTEAKAQSKEECNLKYNMFLPDYKSKNYDRAYENWLWTFENCPDLSIGIYQMGVKIVEDRYENTTGAEKQAAKELLQKVYKQRLEYYPKEAPGDVYNDYAMFCHENGGTEEKVFDLLQNSYDNDPTSLGLKAIFIYFDGIIDRNKDTNIQKVFDMYDNLVDVANTKINKYSQELDKIREKEEGSLDLTKREIYLKKAYSTNLKGLGKIEDGLSVKLEKYATCDRLLPLYQEDFESMKTDKVWLKRSVSRLYNKGCTDGAFYDKMVETYVNADPSSDAYVFYAGMQMKKENDAKALEYFKRAVDLETDNYKKANYLYNIAKMMKDKGRFSEARSYAYQALEARPSLGRAYLLVADMYAKSAKSCSGGDTFTQRMVYQAALNKARKAKVIDPSISSIAQRYINSYASKVPSTEDVFNKGLQSGSPFKLGCWIGETVRIP